MTNWSVDMTFEYERDQKGGRTVDIIRVQEVIDGVSPANDCALWAAQECLIKTVERFNLDATDVQTTKIDVMDVDERE